MFQKEDDIGVVSTAKPQREWIDLVHGRISAWVVLLASIIITVAAWKISQDFSEQRRLDRFTFQVESAKSAIEKRMLDYEQMLRGGVGLFNASTNVTRTMWRDYVATLALDKHFPGVQGVGYSQWVSPKDKLSHTQSIQREGFPNYVVKPEGERNEYTAIIFLEPFTERNQRAFGFDMFSEPTRRQAMTLARDTGQPAMSGRVKLVQETDKDIQYGFLMYLPVYKHVSDSIESRRENLMGFVYSPFRIRDLMRGILGTSSPEVAFEIYDAESVLPDRMMFSSHEANSVTKQVPTDLLIEQQVQIANHVWTIRFEPTEEFLSNNESTQPLLIAVGGIVIDVLLFMIIVSLARLRANANQRADKVVTQLGAREQQFKAITDTANDGIVSANRLGEITYFNKAAEKIFGYTSEEVLGKSISMLMSDKFQQRHDNAFASFVRNGDKTLNVRTSELCAKHKSGYEIPIELSLSSWKVNDVPYVNAIVRDITERKKIERMKNEFVSTVSHELRTPLTAIKGAIGLVASGALGEMPVEARPILQLADNNIDRLTRLINDILDIDKIESGTYQPRLTHAELNHLLIQAIDSNLPLASQAGIKLELAETVNAVVEVDHDQFLQAMTNLISNAIKFSPNGESVYIRSVAKDNVVTISVEDRGVGIPDDFRSQMFKKFAQADSSDRRQKGGTGLGLNITKSIIEKLGGEIQYESKVGVGTKFFVNLPLSKAA